MIGEGTWSCQIWLGMGGQGWGYVVEGHKGNGGERGGGLASLLLQTVFPRKLSCENILRTQTRKCTNQICYRYHSPIASSLPFPVVAPGGLIYSFPNWPLLMLSSQKYEDPLSMIIWQNCTTPPFGISLGWTSIILGCIPKHRKKFGMDPKLRPSQTPTNHPSRFFWHIPHSEPNWKTCVYLKSSINQSGCVESESSFLCTL